MIDDIGSVGWRPSVSTGFYQKDKELDFFFDWIGVYTYWKSIEYYKDLL